MDHAESKRVVRCTTEERVVQVSQSAIATVSDAIRTLQTAALDVRDAVSEIEQVLAAVRTENHHPRRVEMLSLALANARALVQQFEAIGAYDPVPIELLEQRGARGGTRSSPPAHSPSV